MNRVETIKALQKIGTELAEEYGFTNVLVGEDRQKGMWGESLTKHLEETYGECTEEIKWFGDEKEEYISFRYRFANPCLSIMRQGGVFCEIELTDYCNETKERTSEFHIGEISIWQEEGIKLMNALLEKWHTEVNEVEKANG